MTVYYTNSATGHDDNDGSQSSPWLTATKAADTLVAGDSVYLTGTFNERVLPANSGSSGNWITYIGSATIDGDGIEIPANGGQHGLFEMDGKDYIRLMQLNVINSEEVGILARGGADHITVDHCYTYDTVSSGIRSLSCSNIVFDDNEVELACNDGSQECISISAVTTFVVSNNYIHNAGPGTSGGEGIDAKNGSSDGKIYGNHVNGTARLGIYVDAWDSHCTDIEVYNNRVHHTERGGITLACERGGTLTNISIHHNLVYLNAYAGIEFGPWPVEYSSPADGIYIYNNVVWANGTRENASYDGGIAQRSPDAINVFIKNNIVDDNFAYTIKVPSGCSATVDYNLIHDFKSITGETKGANYIEADPLMVDPANNDFTLQSTSPCINAGVDVSLTEDYAGKSVPRGGLPDIGAYEYYGGGRLPLLGAG